MPGLKQIWWPIITVSLFLSAGLGGVAWTYRPITSSSEIFYIDVILWPMSFLIALLGVTLGFYLRFLTRYQDRLAATVEERTKELEFQNELLKVTQAALEQNQQNLMHNAKMASLGEMAGGIAHEINNPLTVVLGRASLMINALETQNPSKEDLLKWIRKISETSERIAKIVAGLRTFARGDQQDPVQPTVVADLVNQAVDLFSDTSRKNEIDLSVDEVSRDFVIHCRPAQIIQVILNFLTNARDAVIEVDSRKVKISVSALEDSIEVAVFDSGLGVLETHREKIFQPFFTTKGVGKGTGLGLSISKGIIEAHGGRLEFGREGNMTKFAAIFPRSNEKMPIADPTSAIS